MGSDAQARNGGVPPTRSSAAGLAGDAAKPRCGMISAEPRPTRAIELFAQGARRVIGFVTPTPLQLGHDQIDKISEGFRCHRVSEIEPILCLPIMPSERSADVDRRAK